MTTKTDTALHSGRLCARILVALFASLGFSTSVQADEDQQLVLTLPQVNLPGTDIAPCEGGFLTCGEEVVVRHLENGEPAWFAKFDGFRVDQVLALPGGEIIMAGSHGESNPRTLAVAAMDGDSNLLWINGYIEGGFTVTDLMILDDDDLLLVANSTANSPPSARLLKIKQSGQLIWNHRFANTEGRKIRLNDVTVGEFSDPEQARILVGGEIEEPLDEYSNGLVILVNDDGEVASAIEYGIETVSEDVRGLHVDGEGDLYAAGRFKADGLYAESYVAKMKPNLSLEYLDRLSGFEVNAVNFLAERNQLALVGMPHDSLGLDSPAALFLHDHINRSAVSLARYEIGKMGQFDQVIEDGDLIRVVGDRQPLVGGFYCSRYVLTTAGLGESTCNSVVDVPEHHAEDVEWQPVKIEVTEFVQQFQLATSLSLYGGWVEDPCAGCDCAMVSGGMVAYWPLGSITSEGDVFEGVFGTPGEMVGDATIGEGMVGKALHLHGEGFVVSYGNPLQEIVSDPEITAFPGHIEFDAWIKLEEGETHAPLLTKMDASGRGYRIHIEDGRLKAEFFDGVDRAFFETDPLITPGEFFHVGVLFKKHIKAGFGYAIMSVNGDLVSDGYQKLGWNLDSPGSPFFIGTDPLQEDLDRRFFRGVIDEAALYVNTGRSAFGRRTKFIHDAGSCGRCRFHLYTPLHIHAPGEVGSVDAPCLLRSFSPDEINLVSESRQVPNGGDYCAEELGEDQISLTGSIEGAEQPLQSGEFMDFSVRVDDFEGMGTRGQMEYRYRVEDVLTGLSNDQSVSGHGYQQPGQMLVFRLDVFTGDLTGHPDEKFIDLKPGRNMQIELKISNPLDEQVDFQVYPVLYSSSALLSDTIRINGVIDAIDVEFPAVSIPPGESDVLSFVVSCDRYLGVANDTAMFVLVGTGNCDEQMFLKVVYFRIIPEVSADCEADINADGEVNGADLAMILSGWSTDDGLADLDRNGEVGSADLGLLLARWGVCEN